MDEILRELLNRLEEIGEAHPELYDSEVRDAMGDAVLDGFIRPIGSFSLPDSFRLASAAGNRQVKDALQKYIANATKTAENLNLNTFTSVWKRFKMRESERRASMSGVTVISLAG